MTGVIVKMSKLSSLRLVSRSRLRGRNLRFSVSLLLVVGVLGAGCGAASGWSAREMVVQEYTAAAVFSVDHIAPDMQFLSFSKAIEAEQVLRVLQKGRTHEIIPAAGSTYHWEWVVGPVAGQVSFQVRSNFPAEANRLATELFATAGPAGRALLTPSQPRPALIPEEVTSASPRYWLGARTVTLSAGLGAGVAVGLFVLGTLAIATPTGRPTDSRR